MGFRYIGSKIKIISNVLEKIKELIKPASHITDLMCGTAAVSKALRDEGFTVTAADIMTYSYHHANVILKLSAPPAFSKASSFIDAHFPQRKNSLFPETPYEKMLAALNNLKPREGYFWREFCVQGKPKNGCLPRNYYSPDNAKKIDAIRAGIKQLKKANQISDIEHSLLLHDLIMAANDVANIAGTYGHYLSKLLGRAKDPLKLRPTVCFSDKSSNKHNVFCGRAEDLAKDIKTDLCYIDPPYMKRQYAANYHILETLAREDEPEAVGISGLRPWRDQYSNFCTKTKIRDSFHKIISEMKCRHFLISYSEDGLLKINEMKSFFSSYGKVEISTLTNKRFKSNQSLLSPEITEYLIYLKKN